MHNRLESLIGSGALRTLGNSTNLIDFCSNDYLGFAQSNELRDRIQKEYRKHIDINIGATGSRLISGNSEFVESLEAQIALYHHAEAGLIFNSGYDANVGLFSSIPQRNDTIIYDSLCHASIRDGIRLSLAKSFGFRHNDMEHLEQRLQNATGNIFVAIESVYSMDGDFSPLLEVVEVCKKYNANLIVDEAHATGIFGKKGEGKVVELGLQNDVFVRVHTFGKAMGCHGGIVLGSENLRNYLINYARSFIYTTAMSFHSYLSIKCAYDKLSVSSHNNLIISSLVSLFKVKIKLLGDIELIDSSSPIQCILIPGNDKVCNCADEIQKAGFNVKAIRSPTVPKGKERLRICIHEFNTEEEIVKLSEVIRKVVTNE
ncbi:MAG: pyridoxal phosphate-dependent aminotransferase family protein [Bacteroidia bacterium]|nr:pyridoxal phosphate-dependent aminotransferase family protein [Bacteroidia bacterium]